MADNPMNRAVSSRSTMSPDWVRDPLESFEDVRGTGPVVWLEPDETWLVTSYEDVYTVLHDAKTYSSEAYRQQNSVELLVLGQDPPIHSKYRRLLNPWLSPGVVDRLREPSAKLSRALLEGIRDRGSGDLVLDYGNPFPARVVLDLCGLPTDEWQKFAEPHHAVQYARPGTPEMEKAVAGMMWMAGEMYRVATERREDPRDDLISSLATADVDGELIPLEDVVGITMTVVGGGVDTTTSLYANAMIYLDRNPEARRRLAADPALIAPACEEFLRHYTPAQILSREVRVETELGGQTLCPVERVGVAIAAANHDETEFADPMVVNIDRSPNRHSAFGLGIHRCVGSNVARMMVQRMVADTIEILPDLEIHEDQARSYESPIVNGWITLPATVGSGS